MPGPSRRAAGSGPPRWQLVSAIWNSRKASWSCQPTAAAYLPGLLALREAPAAGAALARLRTRPDRLFIDGQGMAHRRRFGLACHIGPLAAIPTIDVAKSRLLGRHAPPGQERGDWTPLVDGEDTIGAVLRTRVHTRPLFVSVGHRISLCNSVALCVALHPAFRLPEPIHLADRLSRVLRRAQLSLLGPCLGRLNSSSSSPGGVTAVASLGNTTRNSSGTARVWSQGEARLVVGRNSGERT
jgi:deoxyinosine 3'endonuclease (endonuclease V)